NDALIDAPLALAEARTTGLRRIYANGHRDAWDGSAVFRDAVAKHGGIQLDAEKRGALVHPLTMLMWGELGAWIVSADLARRLHDPGPRRRGFLPLPAHQQIEPVLTEILPYIERDEARHVGLGILHLPARLGALGPRRCRRPAPQGGAR